MKFIKLNIGKEERMINLTHVQEILPENKPEGVKARVVYTSGEILPVEDSFSHIHYLLHLNHLITK
ncbi:hypothetical protein GCM10028803_00540 [Larkinella knui]|uniref:Uncharacterized protein n=1 Tax=Larkinella knui TaxID=2025310 RepID=A0A3P1CJQ0_9BACT|nr:hypothetical protein [Larkinella knui]RRB13458.1 hypothetical protein EHT87_14375 [Larkinella knui]